MIVPDRQHSASRTAFLVVGLSAALLVSCESKPKPSQPPASRPEAVAPAKAAEPAELPLPLIPAAAKLQPARPLGSPTGTFIDRAEGADIRLVSYNVLWNNVFPEISPANADKFVRLIRALNPDILALQEIGVTGWMLRENSDTRDWRTQDCVHILNAISPLPGGASWHGFKGQDNVILSKYPLKMTRTSMAPRGERDQAIALVDLPDERYGIDLYLLNNHYKCCDPERFDAVRQQQSDAIVAWLRDARTPGGEIDLPAYTPFAVLGDLNIVGSFQPVQTLIDGDIQDEGRYGDDFPLDWDDTALADLHPLHNVAGPDDYTWRNDKRRYAPGRIDFVIYTDSVLEAVHSFVLNTTTMTDADLAAAGLQRRDVCADTENEGFDHLPLVVDFRITAGR